jgi:CRP-like cAMP-binding protein
MMRVMAEELLERVLREIRERKQAAQAAYDESRRLERALAALGPRARRPRRTGDGSPVEPPSRRRRPRAAPGANRAAIVALVHERPGVTTGEIAQATEIARSTVTTTLGRLIDAGEVERAELPGGGTGFRPRDVERQEGTPAKPETSEDAASSAEGPPASD